MTKDGGDCVAQSHGIQTTRDATLRSCAVPPTMDPMRTSAWRAVLGSVLVGMSLGACGGGSFTSSGSGADASTGDAGAGGQAGSSGGMGGSATGGAAGAQGGSGGTAQTGGTGASETGGTGGTQTGGTGGTGGTGTGGTGGTTCPDFEHCQPSSAPAPACGVCAQYVCKDLPHCCDDIWDWMCVIQAQTLGECQCKGLVCTSPTFPTPSAGACVSSIAYCNPLKAGAPCGEQQCVVNAELGQLQFQCLPIGEVPACGPCNPPAGKNCDRGFSCVAGTCVRPCCGAQDCGPDSECAPSLLPGSNDGLGICRRL